MPEKEAKRALGIGTLALLANTQAKENGAHTPPRRPAVFLAHASPLSRDAADSVLIISALVDHVEIVGCAGGKDSIEGIQFRCFVPMHWM
jgi:hypothetical protein